MYQACKPYNVRINQINNFREQSLFWKFFCRFFDMKWNSYSMVLLELFAMYSISKMSQIPSKIIVETVLTKDPRTKTDRSRIRTEKIQSTLTSSVHWSLVPWIVPIGQCSNHKGTKRVGSVESFAIRFYYPHNPIYFWVELNRLQIITQNSPGIF